MAEAPDPKSLASWEDAFKHPVATVRGMERQLRSDIDSNKERLRSLVGTSYRDLLGTAESIIQMDSQMQEVETYLGNMSSKCNARLLEKKGSNMKSWDSRTSFADRDRYAAASQLAVLGSCPGMISRLLKSTTTLLLAAKVLVISRLLHTKISQRSNPPPYLDNLRHRLATLRRKLLAKVDRTMKKVELSRSVLVEAMCAFALATSSSATDVLKHYHHVRLEAINELEQGDSNVNNMLQPLKFYVNTLRDTRATVPASLAQALGKLKAGPILRSPDLYALIELNLDLHEKHLGDDIRTFTPYVRVDDLQKLETERLLRQWAKQAFSAFLDNLRIGVTEFYEPHQLMKLRNAMLQVWFSNQKYATGIDALDVVDDLREVFNTRWSRIIREKVSSLANVSSVVQTELQGWQSGISDVSPTLWTPAMLSMETSNGAKPFREALTASLQGRDKLVRSVTEQYRAWAQEVDVIEEVIQQISNVKWEDDLNVIDDEDDILNNKHVLLNEDDPRMLREELSKCLQSSFSQLQQALQEATDSLNGQHTGQKAVFLLRTWREIRQHLPKSYQCASLGRESIKTLQRLAAKTVCHIPCERAKKRSKNARTANSSSRPLWEGDPPLPVLPSPWVFRLLQELSSAMADIGTDVWSPQAITILKQHLRSALTSMFESLAQPVGQTNGHTAASNHESTESQPTEPDSGDQDQDTDRPAQANGTIGGPALSGDDSLKETQIQQLFDMLYLGNATAIKDSEAEADSFRALQSSWEEALQVSEESRRRLRKGAVEYWKRTSLLFALLA